MNRGFTITSGIDVGSASVKAVVMRHADGAGAILSQATVRIRKRDVANVVDEAFATARAAARVEEIDYIASTGEGEGIPFASGHFYGMTTHARGALHLSPSARAVLDVGALPARAVAMDERGRVLDYKMTSQCASGSGQFLENIARYLGVSQAEVGPLSLQGTRPEMVSSICAVLAETDVINMVSRGVSTPNILRGIHESMATGFAKLIRNARTEGTLLVTGGLSADEGLLRALRDALGKPGKKRGAGAGEVEVRPHPDGVFAGAIGAALWGAYRSEKLASAA